MGDTSSNFEGCITHGPWGGSGGEVWDYRPEGFITKIIVCFKDVIDYIQFQSHGSKGETAESSLFGSPGSNTWVHPIRIDYPDEYIKAVSGTYGSDNSNQVVTSICFTTNQNHYGPFGTNKGTVFSYDVKGKAIVGFHGRAGGYLYAIGVHVMPKSLAPGQNLICESKIKNEKPSSIVAMPREAGPWGAGGGKPWDDGVFSSIKQVRVYLGKLNAVYALQFDYLRADGECVVSQIHGGTDGVKIELVPLDVKDEYLTGFSGFYGPVEGCNGLEAIVSISIHTNVRIHGPYGEERGPGYVYFSSTASPGKVVGCHGRSNGFLSAIGVHMDYFNSI